MQDEYGAHEGKAHRASCAIAKQRVEPVPAECQYTGFKGAPYNLGMLRDPTIEVGSGFVSISVSVRWSSSPSVNLLCQSVLIVDKAH